MLCGAEWSDSSPCWPIVSVSSALPASRSHQSDASKKYTATPDIYIYIYICEAESVAVHLPADRPIPIPQICRVPRLCAIKEKRILCCTFFCRSNRLPCFFACSPRVRRSCWPCAKVSIINCSYREYTTIRKFYCLHPSFIDTGYVTLQQDSASKVPSQ